MIKFSDIESVVNIETKRIYKVISIDFTNKILVVWNNKEGFIHSTLDKFEII
jgi:hypothetical protein